MATKVVIAEVLSSAPKHEMCDVFIDALHRTVGHDFNVNESPNIK